MLKRKERRDGSARSIDEGALREGLPWVAEASFLVAAATEEIFEEDLLVLASTLASALGGSIPEEQVMDRFEACANALENDGWEDRLDALAVNLPDTARPLALLAAAVALVSDDDSDPLHPPDAYYRVTEALGYSEEEARAACADALRFFDDHGLALTPGGEPHPPAPSPVRRGGEEGESRGIPAGCRY